MSDQISWTLAPADERTFTGAAFTRLLAGAASEVPIKLYYVRFEPAARTNWHAHSGTQILVVVTGPCRYQREGEPVREAAPGESVRFEAGVRHWHGATPTAPAEHIAVNLDVQQTSWLEPVADHDYATP